jgi:L-ascorbate metabolism protein UlaG (beta-lactamase superfamily)
VARIETPGTENHPDSGWKVTWLGHATAAIEIDGRRVLVDPLGRRRALSAGKVDAILITHAHVDHLNRWTLDSLDRDTHLVVPRGAGPVVADLGFAKVSEVEAGHHLDVGGLDIVAVPTCHDRGRWRKGDDPTCAGYVVSRAGHAIHHAGDVDFADHCVFDELGKQFRLDATLLPIGGMLPVWYYRWRRNSRDRGVHIDPDAALAIAERLGAAAMVPVHWGTVHLRLGLPSMPARRLVKVAAERGLDKLVRVLDHGAALTGSGVVANHDDHAEDGDREADQGPEDAIAHDRVGSVVAQRRP